MEITSGSPTRPVVTSATGPSGSRFNPRPFGGPWHVVVAEGEFVTWTKLSDDFGDDNWSLSDAAFRLHTEALIWSNRKLLDMVIPKGDIARFAKRPEAVEELLDAGWWEDDGDAYTIVHHATYQRLKEDVLKQQRANTRNGKKGGRPAREQAQNIANESPSQPLTEIKTTSVTQWVSDSPTERDRPGQAFMKEIPPPAESRLTPSVGNATEQAADVTRHIARSGNRVQLKRTA